METYYVQLPVDAGHAAGYEFHQPYGFCYSTEAKAVRKMAEIRATMRAMYGDHLPKLYVETAVWLCASQGRTEHGHHLILVKEVTRFDGTDNMLAQLAEGE